jgi:hypothetical protein
VTTCERCGREYAPLRRGYCNRCDMRRRSLIGYECSYVDAEPVRLHVKELQAAGLGLRRIGQLSGVNRKILQWAMTGRSEREAPPSARITDRNAEKILAVPIPEVVHRIAAPRQPVDAASTVRRLQSLVAAGYTRAYLAAQLGMQPGNATRLFRESTGQVLADTARRVEDLFNHLRTVPGPSDIARAEGRKQGWPQPFEVLWHESTEQNRTEAAERKRFEQARKRAEKQTREQAREQAQERLQECNVCGKRTVWHRRGMCGECYEKRRNAGGLEWLAVALAPPGPWIELALCAQIDGDLFFPEKGGSTRDAKKMCLSCEVREECLQHALENEERFGIWGGKSERERRRILKESQPAVAAHTKEAS